MVWNWPAWKVQAVQLFKFIEVQPIEVTPLLLYNAWATSCTWVAVVCDQVRDHCKPWSLLLRCEFWWVNCRHESNTAILQSLYNVKIYRNNRQHCHSNKQCCHLSDKKHACLAACMVIAVCNDVFDLVNHVLLPWIWFGFLFDSFFSLCPLLFKFHQLAVCSVTHPRYKLGVKFLCFFLKDDLRIAVWWQATQELTCFLCFKPVGK